MAYSAGSKHGGDRLIGKRVRTFMARTRTSGGSDGSLKKAVMWEMVRRVREMYGKEGTANGHRMYW
eukprot:gene21615-25998_t